VHIYLAADCCVELPCTTPTSYRFARTCLVLFAPALHVGFQNCPQWQDKQCDCRSGGIDQGYHNYLYHTGQFGPSATTILNNRGIVYTVGMICDNPKGVFKNALQLDPKGMVLTPDGKVAAVVHQADRCTRPKGWVD
jgi:hypothetical protein